MTLEQLSYIGQTVAAVAVLFSLAAVYGQVRQTNKIARADLTHSVWLQAGQMNRVSSYTTPRGTTRCAKASGVKKRGSNVHWAESVSVLVDDDAREEYQTLKSV